MKRSKNTNTSPDVHQTMKAAAAARVAARRARELAQHAHERSGAALDASHKVERDCEAAYSSARAALLGAYPDAARA